MKDKSRLKKTASVLAERDYGKNPKGLQFVFKLMSIVFYRMFKRWYSVSWKYHGWKVRTGFYIIVGGMVFECYDYSIPFDFMALGFALMLLGIAHKMCK